MVNGRIEAQKRFFLVNAPAGSGKTTKIKKMLSEIRRSNPNDNILCITYTNRAAEELAKGMNSDNIFFGTIHSYIRELISPFFKHKQILDLYWEFYGEQIRARINNEANKSNISESNQKYIDKYGDLTEETIKRNLSKISYNETSFNSLYYGGLGHDDLIRFAKEMVDRFPVICKKITNKYRFIFIDEYQDTSVYVLKLFYKAVFKSNAKLYLLGDKMQQIYKNDKDSFEEELEMFDRETLLDTNYRSVKVIIDILNNIYNDNSYKQKISQENQGKNADYPPEIIITSDTNRAVEEQLLKYRDTLVLYLLNKDKFKEIGASKLYSSFSKMKKYSYQKKYHSNDILSDNTQENPDPLMRFLFSFDSIMDFYQNKNFGRMITQCKNHKEFYSSKTYLITKHDDKKRLFNIYKEIAKEYFNENSMITIEHFLKNLGAKEIITDELLQEIIDDEYQDVLNVDVSEVRHLANYLKEPRISTQHGVKGESHKSVLFVAADSNSTPIVHMYDFFRIWSQVDFSLNDIEKFCCKYVEIILNTEKKVGMPIKKLNASLHNKEVNKLILKEATEKMLNSFKDDEIFELLCKNNYEEYLNKQNVSNVKKCFKSSTVYGFLAAYKLFYVGCSRARKNLKVIVDEPKIAEFKDAFVEKVKQIGFVVK